MSIAATGGTTDLWRNGENTFFYDFNDSTANAEDGGDTDNYGGQLSIDPSGATLIPGGGCSSSGVTLGSSSSFEEDVINSILLVNASSADSNCDWEVTGIDLSQSIPREQVADSYSLSFTLTIAAI